MNKSELIRGTRVNYHGIIGGPVTSTNHSVVHEPWQDANGQWVCIISGKKSYINIDALSLVTTCYNLTELSKKHHEQMKKADFYDEDRNLGELLMLCVTELAEAMQADRKGNINPDINEFEAWTQGLEGPGWAHAYETNIKDSLPQELAGAMLRILDICAYLNIDIQKFVDLEMRYNELRERKHGKKY